MSNSKLAPVIIPTLNRFNHFKRCLESLEACKLSNKTDVYIGLDYPPSEKYIEGWQKINDYLLKKEKSNCFNTLNVIRWETNKGVYGPSSNAALVLEMVRENYDRYIISEDDNEFSYRFLEFMNNGLTKFKNDESVFGVCGYMYPIDFHNSSDFNSILLRKMSAWGWGTWFDRRLSREEMFSLIDEMIADEKFKKMMYKAKINGYTGIVGMKKNNCILGDCFYTSYLYYKNKYCLFPKVTLVRNLGWDGSGLHGGKVKGFSDRVIEDKIEDDFKIVLANKEDSIKYDHLIEKYFKNYKSTIHTILDYTTFYCYEYVGFFPEFIFFRKLYRRLRSWLK